jgi:hypothetical protein
MREMSVVRIMGGEAGPLAAVRPSAAGGRPPCFSPGMVSGPAEDQRRCAICVDEAGGAVLARRFGGTIGLPGPALLLPLLIAPGTFSRPCGRRDACPAGNATQAPASSKLALAEEGACRG